MYIFSIKFSCILFCILLPPNEKKKELEFEPRSPKWTLVVVASGGPRRNHRKKKGGRVCLDRRAFAPLMSYTNEFQSRLVTYPMLQDPCVHPTTTITFGGRGKKNYVGQITFPIKIYFMMSYLSLISIN